MKGKTMKLYNVEFKITNRWTIGIDANDEDEARQKVEEADCEDIEIGADFQGQSIDVIDVEEIIDDD